MLRFVLERPESQSKPSTFTSEVNVNVRSFVHTNARSTFVIRSGFDAQKGVRELKRVIERLVEMPLSSQALSGKLARHSAWKAVYDEGGLYFLPQ